MRGDLVFDVLGPLEVRRSGQPVPLGPPQRRRLLLRLLVAGQAPIHRGQLIEDIWGERPTPGNLSSLHAHISRLRAALEPGVRRPTMLVRDGTGYLLHAGPPMLSSTRFEESVRRTRQLLATGMADAARVEIETAMGSWRGAALADAADAPFARAMAGRLEEARLSAEEVRVATLLGAGDYAAATAAARALVAGHPLRESAWELFIRALYVSGRPAEALQQYERIRAALVEELGAEPGAALRELHLAVLRQDAQLDGPTGIRPGRVELGGPATAAAAGPVARGWAALPVVSPAAYQPLVGRDREIAVVDDLLARAESGRTGWAVVSGGFGIGKSALVEWAASRAGADGWDVVFSRPIALPGAEPLRDVGWLTRWLVEPVSDDPGGFDRLVDELARRCAAQRTVWVVEDLDLLEPVARAFLGYLAVHLRTAPLAVVATVRDADRASVGDLTLLLSRMGADRLELRPLGVPQVERISGATDGEALVRRTGGNPFLLRAVLSLPVESRLTVVPPSALSAFRAILRDLPARTRLLLQALADLRYPQDYGVGLPVGRGPDQGANLDVALIAKAADASMDIVDEILVPAVRAGVVSRCDRWPTSYVFTCTLHRDALADRLV
ncbi:BTAD domain-containing putative transcriptional regulator [Micromonospora sp. NBC_01813]|uniref:BTAD domain-containing putative transcriptional regulator n=1 Tax=Micromonospora sp. NBC_01813 TaxID=2975988 RepID=UPI002DD8043B|nr:BTAD domain-containing putative transcriptional regulator [Micromonospora sp. NBC_01813]WSA12057.1 AAA family ATPase [Micromonospora sp. NBC_01813]